MIRLETTVITSAFMSEFTFSIRLDLGLEGRVITEFGRILLCKNFVLKLNYAACPAMSPRVSSAIKSLVQ